VSRAVRVVVLTLTASCAICPRLFAQAPPGRVELGVGPVWIGDSSFGSSDATETTPTGSGSRLFTTSTTLGSAAGLGVHVGVRVWRALEAEVFSTYSKPQLAVSVSGDSESGAAVTATDTLRQYVVGGEALWYFSRGRSSPLRPYVGGGVAYLRQLHESDTLAVTGRMVDFGGGVKYIFGTRPAKSFVRTFGLRADARIVASTKAVGFTDKARYAPSVGASLFVRF
jgi:hypothetical protein